MTQWASQVDTNAPLPEYPRPQLVRTNWVNLNGIWQFQSGATNDPVPTGQTLASSILVPYPMESAISGVMKYYQFSWYRQTFTVPTNWTGKRIILHLDAVNWQSQVYINGQSVGIHKGGYDPASYDITSYLLSNLTSGVSQELIVRVYNPADNGGQPRGKQTLYPGGIMYTSSSGIWQPVWLEPVDGSGVQNLTIIPDVDNSRLRLTVNTLATNGVTISATVLDTGTVVSTMTGSPNTELAIVIPNPKLWSPNSPFLYDLQITVIHNGVTNDSVTSYFGMRKISTSVVGGVPKILLNNQIIFGMGPLDQGFWPDGIYTAPTDAALAYDIQEEKALGFNTVRKHIKVERPRWYYWADKLGIMVWQDMPSCNSYTGNPTPPAVDPIQFTAELTSMVTNHWNSPSIILWVVFNESQGQENTSGGVGQSTTASLVQLVKTLDPSRLVNQASGGSYYGVGDLYDNHNYPDPGNPTSATQAVVDGEFGGVSWHVNGHLWNPAQAGNGYIPATSTANIATLYDFYINEAVNFKSSANGGLNAAIYTEITDVENECNGLLTYDRLLKTDLNKILISNQKAITGQMYLTDVLPTSQTLGRAWKYNTNAVTSATNWYTTSFNDSAWNSGQAGFGTAGTPGAVVRTTWSTSDIWIRQSFNPGNLSANDLSSLVFNCFHDEDCEIYLNGVLASSAPGYSSAYVLLTMNTAGMNSLILNSNNVIAVHCHQTGGGQNIDVGITKKKLVANTLTVPTDALGYWPLDATSGTTAIDASGNGNNGTVNGATWSANGQINGCLNFNGLSNFVQVSNTISSDFSIGFWVKTTQTGGTGQWYQGTGLVDGNLPSATNDFGTALSGGKFGFGVGKPDTTILSTTSINDGIWHLCVATREQTTGALRVYVDGSLETTGTGNTNSLNAAPYLEFGQIASGGGYLNGSLDEIMVFNRALGGNEVTALYYNSAFPAAAPTNLTATIASAQITLSWNSSLWASSYIVSRSTVSGGPYAAIGSTTATAFTDTGLVNGLNYYYVVAAMNTFGIGTNSVEISGTPFALTAWFKADAITGLINGAAVSTWIDVSGNTNNATQTTASQRPTYVTGAMNGMPVVRFNSANTNYMMFNRPVQDDFTILCVFRSSQGFGTGTAFYQGAGLVNGEVSGPVDDFGTSLNTNGVLLAGTGNPDTTVVSANSGYNNGQPHIMTFKRTRSSGALTLYADGVLAGSATGGTQSLTSPTRLVLGAQQTLNNYLTGDIAEVKIFNAPLSDNDRIAEENALKCKYGLGGGSAPAVPTGLTATAGNRKVSCNWAPVAGAASYNLWRATNAAGPFSLTVTGLTTSSYMDTNALNGFTNYYQVAAVSACGTSVNSATASVFLPKPTLGVTSSGAAFLTFSWPSWASDWGLYSSTNLTPPVAWIFITNTVSSGNGQFNVTLPIGSGNQFFRLTSP